MDTRRAYEEYVSNTYERFPIEAVGGKGSRIFSRDGREYVDLGGGCGVNLLGACEPSWLAAVKGQLDKISHTSNLLYSEPVGELARVLCSRTKMKNVFFSNSGAEANEAAIKAARKFGTTEKGDGYTDIITLDMSFHGRTVTTLAATGQPAMGRAFAPLTAGFLHCEPEPERLGRLVRDHKVAAIMLEVVRGEGGVLPVPREFIRAAAQIAREENVLLIADEVQTGPGRCGALFGYMQKDFTPDIVTTAKGLGGGLPIGATLFGEKTCGVLGRGEHGSTFGGNPVACAGALAVLNKIDDELLSSVRAKSEYIFSRLSGAKGIKAVTGEGLMIGITTEKDPDEVQRECLSRGVIVIKAKKKLRLLPALNIPWDDLIFGIDAIAEACG